VQLLVNIMVLTAIYALISCGYVLIYRVSRVLNLAHGELMLLGAYLLYTTASLTGGNPIMAFGLATVLGLAVGALVYLFLMRRMTGEMVLAAVLCTIALGVMLRGATVLIWSAQARHPLETLGWSNPPLILLGDARISLISAILIVATAMVYLALFAFLGFTRWGIRMRAAGQNPLLASQRGIQLHGVYALAWGLSTFTAGLAGMLISLDSRLDGTMVMLGLKAFPAVLVGGLDSLAGALIGSAIVAIAEVLLIQYVNPLLSDVVPFVVLLAVLVVRPWGLFGSKEELDRV
jgi:branched-chain amino acid transport system permease protein